MTENNKLREEVIKKASEHKYSEVDFVPYNDGTYNVWIGGEYTITNFVNILVESAIQKAREDLLDEIETEIMNIKVDDLKEGFRLKYGILPTKDFLSYYTINRDSVIQLIQKLRTKAKEGT